MNNDEQPTVMGRFHEALLTATIEFEHAQAAARCSVTSSTLATLAHDYAATLDNAQHRAMLAADVAEGISLAEAGTIRRAAEAVKLGTPGIICRAAAKGMEPSTIARELGTTGSYVRRILRENPALLAEAAASLKAAAEEFSDTVRKTTSSITEMLNDSDQH